MTKVRQFVLALLYVCVKDNHYLELLEFPEVFEGVLIRDPIASYPKSIKIEHELVFDYPVWNTDTPFEAEVVNNMFKVGGASKMKESTVIRWEYAEMLAFLVQFVSLLFQSAAQRPSDFDL